MGDGMYNLLKKSRANKTIISIKYNKKYCYAITHTHTHNVDYGLEYTRTITTIYT